MPGLRRNKRSAGGGSEKEFDAFENPTAEGNVSPTGSDNGDSPNKHFEGPLRMRAFDTEDGAQTFELDTGAEQGMRDGDMSPTLR